MMAIEGGRYPNWFAPYAQPLFEKHLLGLAGTPGLRFLQIGAFTGDASVWLLDNVLTGRGSTLVDVDTWAGSDENAHDGFDWADVERAYRAKVGLRAQQVIDTSAGFFARNRDEFDFIYVDGDHTPATVLADGVAAYRALKVGGLLAFDDYPWVNPRTGDGPALAIDAIEACHRGRLRLVQAGPQAWFRKIA